ncbi:MAG: NAD(P)-binding domain-containing protein [Candidatus Electryonea clarkiae]|nr:NAD(P)-binding domain-containing protein [Candidatus Electryonea clarkiae]MDP8287886.1 NAD(P)-binding domain-containing protein [Candidatus Electryonea clarkiae]
MKCAIVGGTGWQGAGIATRIVYAGHTAVIGSRDEKRSKALAKGLPQKVKLPPEKFEGSLNEDAVRNADIVFVTVPMSAHEEILKLIAPLIDEQLVIDVTVPSDPEDQLKLIFPPEGSAIEQAQAILGEDADVVAAFKTVSATMLFNYGMTPNSDILICGDDLEAKHRTTLLIKEMGFTAYDIGTAEAGRIIESLNQTLIFLNYAYHLNQPGIKIVEMDRGMEILPDDSMFEYNYDK